MSHELPRPEPNRNLEVPTVEGQVDEVFSEPSVVLHSLAAVGQELVSDPDLTRAKVDTYVQTSNQLLEGLHEAQGGNGRVNNAGKSVFYNKDKTGRTTSISYYNPNSRHRAWSHELLSSWPQPQEPEKPADDQPPKQPGGR